MHRKVAAAGVKEGCAINAAVDGGPGTTKLGAIPRSGMVVGMRLLVNLTTPPIACEPKRNVAGPRMTSTWSLVSGSTGTKWSSPRSDAPLAPMPSSWMRTD